MNKQTNNTIDFRKSPYLEWVIFFGILLLITIHVKLIDIVYNFAIEIGAALFIKLKFSKTA
jgi:hypothetical protein